MEVVYHLTGVPDGQPGDDGLPPRHEQENVADPQVDGIHPPPLAVETHRIAGDMCGVWALAQCLASDHPPRVVTRRFNPLSGYIYRAHLAFRNVTIRLDTTACLPPACD